MTNIPVRNVGSLGLIKDQHPFDLADGAWSAARNVSFTHGSVERSPIFRDPYPDALHSTTEAMVPAGGFLYRTPGSNKPITVTRDYHMLQWETDGTLTDVTPVTAGWTDNSFVDRVTSAFVGGVTYCNRATAVPVFRTPADTVFAELTGWDSTYRAKSLREFKSILIAMGITKGANTYPAMYKWSDEIQYGSPPPNWDTADLSSISGENTPNDTKSGLIDGLSLGDFFIMYTATESYFVEYVGGDLILQHRKLFADDGIMSVNCVVEVDNKHFVFGQKDIYVHDGLTKSSLLEGRLKKFIYSALDYENRDRCHVSYDKVRGEITFAMPVLLDEAYRSPTGDCTMGFVYNIIANTWAPIDLPWTVSSFELAVNPADAWSDLGTQTWQDLDGAWTSFASSGGTVNSYVSAGTMSIRPRILVSDDAHLGRVTAPPATDFAPDWFIERIGIDMDNIGADLAGRRMVRGLYPQCVTGSQDVTVGIRIGSAAFSSVDADYGDLMQFNPYTMYKVDSRVNGRYLALRFEGTGNDYWRLSGYDLDLVQIAGR